MDAILSILKSVGYTKTEQDVDQVSVKEPDIDRAMWVSLDLFLVQLELQIIKKIMDSPPESNCTLKDIVKARTRTYTVEAACKYLSSKAAKRRKLDAVQGGDAASDKQVQEMRGGEVNATFSDERKVVVSADHSSGTHSKDHPPSSAAEDEAMDVDDSSTAFVVAKKDQSAGVSADYKEDVIRRHLLSNVNPAGQYSDDDLYGVDRTGSQPYGARQYRFDAHLQSRFSPYSEVTKGIGGSHSLSFLGTGTTSHYSHLYSTQGYAHLTERDLRRFNVVPQSTSAARVLVGTNAVRPEISTRGDEHSQSSWRSENYAHLRDISSSDNQHVRAKELPQPDHEKEVVTRPNDASEKVGQRRVSVPEPVKLDQTEHCPVQNNYTSYSKGMTGGVYARAKSEAGVSDLKTNLQYHLTLENGTSKQRSSEREDISSRVGNRRVAHMCGREVTGIPLSSRFSSQGAASYVTATRTADGRGFSLHKTEEKGLFVELPKKGTHSAAVQNANEVSESKRISTPNVVEHFSQSLQKDHYSEGSRSDPVDRAAASPLTKDHYSEGARSDPVDRGHYSERSRSGPDYRATASSLKEDHYSEGARSDPIDRATALSFKTDRYSVRAKDGAAASPASICGHCMSREGQIICKNCLVIICKTCETIFETNLCETTKGQHMFEEIKGKERSKKVIDGVTLSNQRFSDTEWPCSRCTYLNSPEHGICVLCAATRGFDAVEESKPGSTVCKNCTLHNDANEKVCVACHKTLDHNETFV